MTTIATASTATTATNVVRERVVVRGVVQGVGFRPFVYGLATRLGLAGTVVNGPDGVTVEVEGPTGAIDAFAGLLVAERPPLARIETVERTPVDPTGTVGFTIGASTTAAPASGTTTLVPPDVAACDACLAEIDAPYDRRHRYPFTTCTHCRPRFTIITALPYDRPNTTMAGFPLCPACAQEYHDPADRRFHAQPVACPDCGPQLAFRCAAEPGHVVARREAALLEAQRLLAAGGIVAVKGIGGYHLACDAADAVAVEELRRRKGRRGKPLAVMAADLDAVRRIAHLEPDEVALLTDPVRPIVLLRARRHAAVARIAAPGNGRLGVMLPYSPLHHLLFRPEPSSGVVMPRVLVMTSGNVSDEPILTDDDEALAGLATIADGFLQHDRPIHVPVDDSVVRVVDGAVLPVRRSRGHAPFPIALPFEVDPVLAVGAELKSTACVASGRHAWMTQHLGDMGNLPTLRAFGRAVQSLADLQQVTPMRVAADLHPEYLTTRWARPHAGEHGLPLTGVQHHHAHVAACMAEHGVPLGHRVIGFAFDGTGFGTDGSIWGGEVLAAGYDRFDRVAHLAPVRLPGGDAAVERPRRTALAHLHAAGVPWDPALPPVAACDPTELRVLARQFETGFGTTPTTSMGRLFDAVASIAGVRHEVTYEAQAAIEFEALVDRRARDAYRFGVATDPVTGALVADPSWVIAAAAADALAGTAPGLVAAWFHHAVADLVADLARRLRADHGDVVALTGGVFQNVTLLRACRDRLERDGFTVLHHRLVPPNDGGLALGQAVVAAAQARSAGPDR